MGQSKLCRLCAEENDSLVRIYEEEGQKLNLATKIIQCLQIWLYPEDPLPKTVCMICLQKLDQYFEFFETTSRAQISLQVLFDPKVNNSKTVKKESGGSLSRSKNRSKEDEGRLENGQIGDPLSQNRGTEIQDDEADTEPPELVECVLSDKGNIYFESKPTASRRKCRNPIKRTALSKEREKVGLKERGSGKNRTQNLVGEDPYDPDFLAFQESLPLQERLLNMERNKTNKARDAQRIPSRDIVSSPCDSMSKQTNDSIKDEQEKEETEDDKSNVDTSLTEDEAGPVNHWSGSKRPRGEKKKNTQKSGEKPPRPKTVMEGYPWQCTTCPSVLNTLQELRRHHQDVHQQPPIFKCVQCTKTYTRYRSFARHYKLHRNPKKYKCEECGKCFSQKTVLQSHSTVHTDARPHVCPQCGKAFKQFSSLYLHSKCHLPDQVKPKFPCDICNKEFATKHTLETHRKIHTGERNFICDICGKSFIAKGSLDYHILTHSGEKPHHCSVCGKGFKTARLLGKHATLHTGIKPHQCDVCGKQFRERGALREHNRIHTGAMPYSCEFCGKHFRFKGILTVHRRQHTGERPYGCAECRREFTNWANYNKHMKRRHRPPEAAAAATGVVAAAIATSTPIGSHPHPHASASAPSAPTGVGAQIPGVAVPVPNVISANAAATAVAAVSHRDQVYQSPEVSSVTSNCTNTVRAHQSVMSVNNVDAVSVSGAVAPSVPGSSLSSSYTLPQHSAMCDNSNSSVNSLSHGMSTSGAIMPTGTSMYGTPNQGTKIGNIYGPPGTGNSLGAGIVSKLPVSSSLSTMLHGSSSVVGAIGGSGHKMPMSNVFHISQHHNQEPGDRVMERVMERSQPNNPLVGSYVPSYVPTGLPMGGMGYYIPPIHHAEHGIEMLHNRSGSSQ